MRCSIVFSIILSFATADKARHTLRKTSKRELVIKAIEGPKNDVPGQDICNVFGKNSVIKNTVLGAHNITQIDAVTVSERFLGMKVNVPKGILGLEDTLDLNYPPTNPLTIERNFNHRENIYIEKQCQRNPLYVEGGNEQKRVCTLKVMGRGPAGFKGLGAMAFQFDKGQSNIQLEFWSDGAAEAVVMFYDAKANHLGTLQVNLGRTNKYFFVSSLPDIFGMAIWPKGEQMEWHYFGLVGLCLD